MAHQKSARHSIATGYTPTRAGLGIRTHSGWAALVAVAGSVTAPEVIDRWRLEMVDRRIAESVQPYHAAARMDLQAAEAFLARCAESSKSMTIAGLRRVVGELTSKGCKIAGACVLLGSGRPSGNLAQILASHVLIHTAEGEFFRNAVRLTCESCGLAVTEVKEKELLSRCANKLAISGEEFQRRVSGLGVTIGPPWRQDEKLCAAAAWLLL